MLKLPILSVWVNQEATSSPENSNTLLETHLPSQDGKWTDSGLCPGGRGSLFGIWLTWSLSLSHNPSPLPAPWLRRGSLKGQLEPLNEVG